MRKILIPTDIIPDGTRVRFLLYGEYVYGKIGDNDSENSEEDLSDLNYYIVPDGGTWDDYVMMLWSSIEII